MLVAALTRWILRHQTLVVLVWLGLTAAGAASAPRAIQAMSSDFGSLPGRPGYEANQQLRRLYGNGGDANPLVLVVQLPEGTTVDSPGVRAQLAAAVARATQTVGAAGPPPMPTAVTAASSPPTAAPPSRCCTRHQDPGSRPTPRCCPASSRPWTAPGWVGRRSR